MRCSPNHLPTFGAFVIGLGAFGALLVPGLVNDPTPMLAAPSAVPAILLGAIGLAAGLWSAHRIATLQLPTGPAVRRGRWALYIVLPAVLCLDLALSGNRLVETLSFRRGGTVERATVLVVGKETDKSRSGRVSYVVSIANPVDQKTVQLHVRRTVHSRIEPNRDCVTLLTERASNGALRIVRPVEWRARCPWSS